jgi:alkaline phosphatase
MDVSPGGSGDGVAQAAHRRRFVWLFALLCGFAPLAAAAGEPPTIPAVDWNAEGRDAIDRAKQLTNTRARARNVILFVGDGMGISTVTAARILQGQLRGEPGEENLLSFERFPFVALSKTYNTNQQTPDSAGTMTAMVTGAKTRAGVISVDQSVPRGDFEAATAKPLETIVERAEKLGLSTGLVTTTTVTHATPAALFAHSPERVWESDSRLSPAARSADFPDIARQLVEFRHGDGMDVVLGGGEANFLPTSAGNPAGRDDGRNLTAEWLAQRKNSQFVRNCDELASIDSESTERVLGLFAASHMQFEVDRAAQPHCEPSLTQMTDAALSVLERNRRGYFLMVEGGRIDHAHHSSNAHRALHDAVEFANAIARARERTSESDTLIVVTADHGHVLMMAGYPTRGNDILGLVVENDDAGEPDVETLDAAGLPYTTLGYLNGPGYVATPVDLRGGKYSAGSPPPRAPADSASRPDLRGVNTRAPDYKQESAVPLLYETHSGEDVAIYASGPGAALFHGVQEQSFIFHAMVESLGWNDPVVDTSDSPH